MRGSRQILVIFLLPILPVLFSACGSGADDTTAATTLGVPTFQVDPTWPREMPNDWIMGSVTAVFVDSQDHIWVTHLPETLTPEETSAVHDPPIGMCCVPAPVVIEFDPQGEVVQAWGDPSTQDISAYTEPGSGSLHQRSSCTTALDSRTVPASDAL